MLDRIKSRTTRGGHGPWIMASAVLVALLVTPFAIAAGEGKPLLGGKRNPSANQSQAFNAETQIIANNATYGTRQSNKGAGGGAIYGCRSAPGAEPCVRANNLAQGRAFELTTGGAEAGRIEAVGGDNARPFTTNATGVATGLNADRVDGRSADEIVATAQALNKFAAVSAAGALAAGRGAATASADPAGAGTYTVTFTDDVSRCAYTATETTVTDAGATSVDAVDARTIRVNTRDAGGALADRPFHLVVTC